MPDKFFYKGIPSLNGTIVPDDVFDVLMPLCSGAEFKVLAYIVRRTFGFKKESDSISLKQMVDGIQKRDGVVLDRGTGLSKPTVTVAIKGLEEKGIIEAQRNSSKEKGDEPTIYRLRFEGKQPVLNNLTGGSKKTEQGGVKKSNTQETEIQTTGLQIRNSNSKLSGNVSNGNEGYKSFKTIGDLLKKKTDKKPVAIQEIPEQIKASIDEISKEFGEKNYRSNLTHVMRIYQESGKSMQRFTSYLYEAKSITKQQGRVKKMMPYFFSVLENIVGLKESPMMTLLH
jgi:DNA-binding transcriptional ArsR family regulator